MTAGKPPVQSFNRFLRKTRRQSALATACVGTGRWYDRNHGSPIAIHRSL